MDMRKKKTTGRTNKPRVTIDPSEQDKPIWKTYHMQIQLCDESCEKYHVATAVLAPEMRANMDKLTDTMKEGLALLEDATALHDAYKKSLRFFIR